MFIQETRAQETRDIAGLEGVSAMVAAAAVRSWGREAAAGGPGMLATRLGPGVPGSARRRGALGGVTGPVSPPRAAPWQPLTLPRREEEKRGRLAGRGGWERRTGKVARSRRPRPRAIAEEPCHFSSARRRLSPCLGSRPPRRLPWVAVAARRAVGRPKIYCQHKTIKTPNS